MIREQDNSGSDSLKATEALGALGAVAPRVSLKDMEDAIASVHYLNAGEALLGSDPHPVHPTDVLTLCFITFKNGFVIIGESASASVENFDWEKGQTFAYENAIRKAWPLFGFALREKLSNK